MSDALLRHDLAKLTERVAHGEGRIEALHVRFHAHDARQKELLILVGNVLAHNGAMHAEVLSALSRGEEQFLATRRAVEEMGRSTGDMARRFSELAERFEELTK